MTTMKRNTRMLFASAAAVALATVLGASPALAEGSSSVNALTYSRPGDGLTGMPSASGTLAPMSFILDADGTDVFAYCVQLGVDIDNAAKFAPASYSSSGVSNLAKVADLVRRHNEIGTPYPDARWEAAVTQAAIWSLTDGLDVSSIPNTAFAARAQELAAAASAISEPAFQLNLNSTSTVDDLGQVNLTVKVTDASGTPASGLTAYATVGDSKQVSRTGVDGSALFVLPAKFAGQSATVSATTDVAAGVFLKASSGQSLVTASAAPLTTSQAVTLAAAPATPSATPTPQVTALATPAASAVPTPVTTVPPVVTADVPAAQAADATPVATVPVAKNKKPKELPHTGGELSPALVLALLAVAGLAGGGWVISRRK